VQFVAVHLVRLTDGTATSQVVARGTRLECEAVADEADHASGPGIVGDFFMVRPAPEWEEIERRYADPIGHA
jgi:hypothetical protein